jgi:hypothetical protein
LSTIAPNGTSSIPLVSATVTPTTSISVSGVSLAAPAQTSQSEKSSLPVSALVGGTIAGAVVLLLAMASAVLLWILWRRSGRADRHGVKEKAESLEEGPDTTDGPQHGAKKVVDPNAIHEVNAVTGPVQLPLKTDLAELDVGECQQPEVPQGNTIRPEQTSETGRVNSESRVDLISPVSSSLT